MVRLTFALLWRKIPDYWTRHIERYQNERVAPPRYVYLRGWVGQDRRKNWIETQHSARTQQSIEPQPNSEAAAYKAYISVLKTELIEPIKEWIVFEGDRVEILVGRDKGKHGIVSKIVHERNWVFVEALNTQCTHTAGKIISEEMPLDVSSEVKLVDPITLKPAEKVEWRYTEDGDKIRVSFPSELNLPLPRNDTALPDGVKLESYTENLATDTVASQLEGDTYKPTLKPFRDEILESMGVKDDSKRHQTYWY